MQISWQAQHFRKVNFSQGLKCVAGAALSKGQVQISGQAQHFRKVKYRFRGKQISWQAQYFRKVKYRFRGRRSTFASLGTAREIDR